MPLLRVAIASLLCAAAAPGRAELGSGLRIGGTEGRLHPFLELQAGYDSDVFVGTAGGSKVGDGILHVRPGLTLEVPSSLLAVNLAGALDWAQYLGLQDTGSRKLSRLYADARLGLAFNPRGTLGVQLDDDYRLSNRAQSLTSPGNVATNYNALDVRLPWRPGGGALTVTLNGDWQLETYQELLKGTCAGTGSPACDVTKLGYNQYGAGLGVAWRFLPRTAIVLDGGWFHRVPTSTALAVDASGYRVDAGLSGLVTAHLAATLKAGYGSTIEVSSGRQLGTWLATAEAEWLPNETSSVKLGYAHDFALDPSVPVYQAHRLKATARALLTSRVSLGALGAFDLLQYVGGGDTRLVQAGPSLGYEVARWLKTELSATYTDRSSSSAGVKAFALNYSKVEAWLKVIATY